MGNGQSSDGVGNPMGMRILGGLLIALSVAEFGVGGAIYGFMTNVHLGAWWGAICTFISGVLGLLSLNRGIVTAGCVFSVFGIIIAAVGTIVDGIAYEVVLFEKGCINTDTGDLWGSDEGKGYALECVAGIHSLYGYNNNNYNNNFYYYNNYYSGLSTQCVCSDKTNCYGYDLAKGDNCGTILTTYTGLLSVSPALLTVLTVMVFIYSVFTCVSICGTTSAPPPPAPVAASGQVQIQMQPVPVAYGSVPQQQGVMYVTPQSQPQQGVVYAMAPTEEKAMLGVNP